MEYDDRFEPQVTEALENSFGISACFFRGRVLQPSNMGIKSGAYFDLKKEKSQNPKVSKLF